MRPQPLQFSLAWLLTVVTAACVVFAAAAWLGAARITTLGMWLLPVILTTLPIYAFALSLVTLATSGAAIRRRRTLQVVLFLCCLPIGWLALLAILPLLR